MLYSILNVLLVVLARLLFRLQVSGRENIPEAGGFIIASNHLSYLDIPLIGCSIKHHVDFVGKRELFQIPVIGYLFRILGGLPIDRDKIDRAAIREAVKRLKAGRVLGIYPEGTRSRSGRLQPGKPGVGLIVKMSGTKVVPVAIQGTDKAMPVGKWMIRPVTVTIRFGRPIDFSDLNKKNDEIDDAGKITGIIMDNIAALLRAS